MNSNLIYLKTNTKIISINLIYPSPIMSSYCSVFMQVCAMNMRGSFHSTDMFLDHFSLQQLLRTASRAVTMQEAATYHSAGLYNTDLQLPWSGDSDISSDNFDKTALALLFLTTPSSANEVAWDDKMFCSSNNLPLPSLSNISNSFLDRFIYSVYMKTIFEAGEVHSYHSKEECMKCPYLSKKRKSPLQF